MSRAAARRAAVIQAARGFFRDYPDRLTPAGAAGKCRWAALEVAARAGAASVAVVRWSVLNDDHSDHWAVWLGGGWVLDPTAAQVKDASGVRPRLVRRVGDYPENFKRPRLHHSAPQVAALRRLDMDSVLDVDQLDRLETTRGVWWFWAGLPVGAAAVLVAAAAPTASGFAAAAAVLLGGVGMMVGSAIAARPILTEKNDELREEEGGR